MDLETLVISKQQAICSKYNVEFLPVSLTSIIGVALDTFNNHSVPINGLRHPITKDGYSSWYIWTGEYSDAENFFKPIHVSHLFEICPKAIDYLGLSSGWRFLFDKDYEDVWYDKNLLNI